MRNLKTWGKVNLSLPRLQLQKVQSPRTPKEGLAWSQIKEKGRKRLVHSQTRQESPAQPVRWGQIDSSQLGQSAGEVSQQPPQIVVDGIEEILARPLKRPFPRRSPSVIPAQPQGSQPQTQSSGAGGPSRPENQIDWAERVEEKQKDPGAYRAKTQSEVREKTSTLICYFASAFH